jgi:hypothetical protein
MKSPERRGMESSPEMEKPTAKIRLEFFRHDEKAKPTDAEPRPDDNKVRLTETGRASSTLKGKEKNPHPEVAISYGSPRERSQETAMRQMLANEDAISADMSLEDMRHVIDGELKVGKKDIISDKLNFYLDGNQTYHDEYYRRYLETKDALLFIWQESDKLARELGDTKDDTYSRFAGKFAELVDKYVKILPRWQQIVSEKPEEYSQFNNEMQRFFGSHQTALECFLLKVIEKTEGSEAVREFINSLPDKNGFGFSEGFTVEIEEASGNINIFARFKDKQWQITPELILQIINDREEFEKSIVQQV